MTLAGTSSGAASRPGVWQALERRSDETGEPVRHLVAAALADFLDVDHQTIFQVSTVGALVEGVYEGAVRIGTLREHGDFGLGTFEGLDGEMVALDGDFFRVRDDGALHPVDDDVLSPYAMVTHFVPGPDARRCPACASFDALCAALDELRDSSNHFFAFRVDGTFPTLHVRAACKVPEGTPLVEAATRQREWKLEDVRGTLGRRSGPRRTPRTSTCPGYHFHVVDEHARARRARPRLLDRRARGRRCSGSSSSWSRSPRRADFLSTDLARDPSEDLDTVERAH